MDIETAAQEFWRVSREARLFGADGLTRNAIKHLQKSVEQESVQIRLAELIGDDNPSKAQAP
jgi:hypothetical protein